MGSPTAIGTPLLKPNTEADRKVAPTGWITAAQTAFLEKLRPFWSLAEDVNSSDLDLCEYENQTVMYFNVGEQHYDNALALAVSPLPLHKFLQGFFRRA
mmetsp:Transcript_14375/g.38164  ORF Transcript_14375/g.38164 Transcript_14375/m.38164 type:complete len:99 (-) Transcript_14375:146-442(-)